MTTARCKVPSTRLTLAATTGNVNYTYGVGQLASVTAQGTARLAVDTGVVPVGGLRGSVKVRTLEAYGLGNVFVLDANHMPYGCSVWPACVHRRLGRLTRAASTPSPTNPAGSGRTEASSTFSRRRTAARSTRCPRTSLRRTTTRTARCPPPRPSTLTRLASTATRGPTTTLDAPTGTADRLRSVLASTLAEVASGR